MRKIIVIILIAFIANLLTLTIGYSQNSIGVSGYVPETDLNRNINRTQVPISQDNQPLTKENKYKYFFEKFWLIEQERERNNSLAITAQTSQDRFSSFMLMISLLVIFSAVFVLILRLVDHSIIPKWHLWRKKS